MNQQPIAFADPSGFVVPVPHNVELSEHARVNLLTPLYTQEQVQEHMAAFYANQDATAQQPLKSVETTEVQATTERVVRKAQSKAYTGTSIAEAARAALANNEVK